MICLSGCGYAALVGAGVLASTGGKGRSNQLIPEPVQVTTPSAVVHDRVPVEYTLKGEGSLDIGVEFSTAGESGPFAPATEATGAPSQGVRRLTASAEGNPHVFIWNSFHDLDAEGVTHSATIAIRVTAKLPLSSSTAAVSSTAYGRPAVSLPFSVDNRLMATVAGAPATASEGIPGEEVPLAAPEAAIVGSGGNIFVADTGSARVRLEDAVTRLVITEAGSGIAGYGGDGGLAQGARLLSPRGLALDARGDLLFADGDNHRIRRVDALTGIVTTIAGSGSPGFAGDGGAATAAELRSPHGLAFDAVAGTLWIADTGNHAIRTIDASGTIRTVAGTGSAGSTGDGGPATAAALDAPEGICLDGAGGALVADTGNHAVRRIRADGTIATIAGTLGQAGLGAEGANAAGSLLRGPRGVTLQGAAIVVADSGNNRLRRFTEKGTIATIAGALDGTAGFAGDDGPAGAALLSGPANLAPDGAGGVLVADAGNNRVRRLGSLGEITTVMGSGSRDASSVGDGGPASEAQFVAPDQIAIAADGSIYVADDGGQRVRKFTPGGIVSTVAGTGDPGLSGDGGLATRATLNGPFGIAIDSAGVLFIAERYNARVRAVNPSTGIITTVAGGGTGPDGVATLTSFVQPEALVSLPASNGNRSLLVVDGRGNRIRRLTYQVSSAGDVVNGTIDTVAGTGDPGGASDPLSQDGTPAVQAHLYIPLGTDYDVDASGQIWIYTFDQFGGSIRKFPLTPALDGRLTTVAGGALGAYGGSGDGGPAIAATFSGFYIAIDRGSHAIYVADFSNNRIRRFKDGGTIDSVAGNGDIGDSGLGGPATAAPLPINAGVAVEPDGSVVTGAQGTRRIYRFVVGGTIEAIAGVPATIAGGDGVPATAAVVRQPIPAVAPDETLYIVEDNFGRVRRIDPASGTIATVVGQGVLGIRGNPGPLSKALVDAAPGICTDAAGRVYLAELNEALILGLDTQAGTVATFAGNGSFSTTGDGGPALAAGFTQPVDVAIAPASGALYVADLSANCIRRIDRSGTVTTIAGGQTIAGAFVSGTDAGENVPAVTAFLPSPTAIAIDRAETVYVAQAAPVNTVRKITPSGTIVTIAGIANQQGYNGDDIPARSALLDNPQGLAVDDSGNVYVADQLNNRVRRVDAAGFISTVAGTGEAGSGPDGVIPTLSKINGPTHLVRDEHGNLFVGEFYGNRVRRFRVFP